MRDEAPNSRIVRTRQLLGVRIDVVSRKDLLTTIERAAETGTGGLITNVNVHAMNLAWNDNEFRTIVNQSDLVFVDGIGVKLGARLSKVPVGDRLTPADWIDEMFSMCVQKQWSVFWLGDTEDVGLDFERELARRHPQCVFAGRHHGFFVKTGSDSDRVVDLINQSEAKILMVGMSMPIQEKWLSANRHLLRVPVLLPLGGMARIYTGTTRRGPRWMTDYGMEWLFRLAVQPRDTWKRYVIGNPLFIFRIAMARFGFLRVPR